MMMMMIILNIHTSNPTIFLTRLFRLEYTVSFTENTTPKAIAQSAGAVEYADCFSAEG